MFSLVSIIVPTLNEAENLPELARRVATSMGDQPYELLIIDDASTDDTPRVCHELAKDHPIRLIVRSVSENGLSGAVLHGFANARGEALVVMDADLQHPPERIGALLGEIASDLPILALGSRHVTGGSTADEWTAFRRLNSKVATLLAKPIAGNVLDPMSGFFALRRSTLDRAELLAPTGYKIALELIAKCRVDRVAEVPIHFDQRHKGSSKLTIRQQIHYLEHLNRLYDFAFPRLIPIAKFVVVLAISWSVAAVAWLANVQTLDRAGATILAYAFAIGVTGAFHYRYVVNRREFIRHTRPWRDFALISLGEMLAVCCVVGWLELRVASIDDVEYVALAFFAATVVRYVLRKELLQDVRGLRKDPRRVD